MAMSQYTNFLSGVIIRDIPLLQMQPGKIFWVNNSGVLPPGGIGGSDVNPGTYLKPFSTIAQGLLACTANRGDIIVLMPGHAETLSSATSMTINVAGVALVGVGRGLKRPTLTLGTATTATLNVTAAQVTLHNILFVANFAAVASAITTTTAADLLVHRCEFKDTSSILNFGSIVTTAATSNVTDGLSILDNNMFLLGATAATTMVNMLGTNSRLTIANNYMQNKSTSDGGALMIIATGKIVTHAQILDNTLNSTGTAAGTAGTLITTDGTTNTGVLARNYVQNLDATTEILATASSGFVFFDNKSSAVADKSGYLLPAADS